MHSFSSLYCLPCTPYLHCLDLHALLLCYVWSSMHSFSLMSGPPCTLSLLCLVLHVLLLFTDWSAIHSVLLFTGLKDSVYPPPPSPPFPPPPTQIDGQKGRRLHVQIFLPDCSRGNCSLHAQSASAMLANAVNRAIKTRTRWPPI